MPQSFPVTVLRQNHICEIPNQCPICHHKITIESPLHINIQGKNVQALFICPNHDCHNYFITYYELQKSQGMVLLEMVPSKVQLDSFLFSVALISPSFISIYQEASQARALGLQQIAGPGYRKAFEFLLKDYAKLKSSKDKHEEIEKTFSGDVIKNYISDARIQKVSKRALWLGNDETHYLRQWQGHDIDDLITLIKLTVNWIEIEQLSDEYTTELPDKSTAQPST